VISQNVKYKFVQDIVNTLGAEMEKVIDNLHNGPLWLSRVLADLTNKNLQNLRLMLGPFASHECLPKVPWQCGWIMQN
jgi:hypothetical protein